MIHSDQFRQFQEDFGKHISLPMDFSSGQMLPPKSKYSPELCERIQSHRGVSSEDRLAAYNAQYWYRLLGVLQEDFPLLAQLMGMWNFNQWASDFLSKEVPHKNDLNALCGDFHNYLSSHCSEVIWLQAARIDLAYHRTFLSAEPSDWDPSGQDSSSTLCWNSIVDFFAEDWALVEMRQDIDTTNEIARAAPPQARKYWVVYRENQYLHTRALDEDFYTLLDLLRSGLSLDQCFEKLSQLFDPSSLEPKIPAWFQSAIELKWWKGWQKCDGAHT